MASGSRITRIYSNFRGVDFRGEDINIVRSPDSLNMWKDYKEVDSIRTRPKLERIKLYTPVDDTKFYEDNNFEAKLLTDTVYGYHYFHTEKGTLIEFVHCGKYLYGIVRRYEDGFYVVRAGSTSNNPDYVLQESPSESFVFEGNLYIKTAGGYYETTSDLKIRSLNKGEGYMPTTSIGRRPSGGGTIHEDINMLSDWRINTFIGDGESTEYYLDARNIDEVDDDIDVVGEVGYVVGHHATVDYEAGKIVFKTPPPAPLTDGQDNVVIRFKKTVTGHKEKILDCTSVLVFDNRVFFGGNPNYPNMIWHSSLDNPTYVSDLDYYEEGFDTARVTGMVAGNNALWVFKEPSPANTTIFYHTPAIDSEYGKIYPSSHSNIAIGCIGKAINFNDDIVFFSERGMEGIHGDVTSEQVLGHRSTMVDSKLTKEADYKNMVLTEWEGYLLVFIGNKVYLADSRATFSNEDHQEYEWFYWELDVNVICAKARDGVLYVGTTDGFYKLTDKEGAVKSYWTTPKDKFQYPQYMKTTNKRGCVSEVTGDVSVSVKTDKTNDFEWINSYYNVSDYIVSRIKRKKFKDIQLKFASDTRFSLESATLECFVGGYIKR